MQFAKINPRLSASAFWGNEWKEIGEFGNILTLTISIQKSGCCMFTSGKCSSLISERSP